jgi:hypothetical protein
MIVKATESRLVEGWLREMQCDPRPAVDPNANWRFDVKYPANTQHQISVANPKKPSRAVVIVCGVGFAPLHVAAFEGLEHDEKHAFAFALQEALNRDYVEFQLLGVDEKALSCPTGIQLVSTIYDDGLSLDMLATRMLQVLKAEVAGGLCINRYLGPSSSTGGAGQFEFRRLGTIQ